MSPFQKNFQHFLIFFFTAIPVVIVALGIMRAKRSEPAINIPPDQGQQNKGISEQAVTTPSTDTGTAPISGAITFTGKTTQTPWGSAVAAITVTNGKITGVSMPQVPNSPPSIYAEPYLVQQALTAGSANIQGVSGATYTSLAFKSSLESAIIQANSQTGQTVTPAISTTPAPTSKPSVPRRYRDDD